MGTTMSPLLNPVIRGLWCMLMATVCLLDSGLGVVCWRPIQYDNCKQHSFLFFFNLPFISSHPSSVLFVFFFQSFLHFTPPFFTFPSSFSYTYIHLINDPTLFFPLPYIHLHSQNLSCIHSFRPCLIPLWWTLHSETQNYELQKLSFYYYSFILLPFFIYIYNPILSESTC